jgi:enoyl-CoA hydratase
MASPSISIERQGAIAILRLNRPPANAFCLELAREFEAAFDDKLQAEARALVLTGSGRFFSGGLDLKAVPTYSKEQQRDFLDVLNRLLGKLYACPIPVVGAINGHAIAGAFILALATDYRIGPTTAAQFGLTEARVGIPFPAVPMIILQAELGPQDVRYSTLYARTFGPEEALRRGLLDELQPPEAVVERAVEVARDLASMPADAYRRIKHQVRQSAIAQIEEVIATGADPMLEGWLSPEAQKASSEHLKGSKARSI